MTPTLQAMRRWDDVSVAAPWDSGELYGRKKTKEAGHGMSVIDVTKRGLCHSLGQDNAIRKYSRERNG